MKRIDFKVKLQWNWYKATLIGAAIAVMAAPTAGALWELQSEDVENHPIVSSVASFVTGPKTKVIINGEVVALAKSKEDAQVAYRNARLAYNAKGVKLLDIDMQYELVDKEKDKKKLQGVRFLRGEKLESAILACMEQCEDKNKSLAYTMRIDDYTVTVADVEDIVSVLEEAQSKYDVNDDFKVLLKQPAHSNVTMCEVAIEEATNDAKKKDAKGKDKHEKSSSEQMKDTTQEQGQQTDQDENNQKSDKDVAIQAVDDGVKFVGFSEKVQVTGTYVDEAFIADKKTTYEELTAENKEPGVYVVQPGDTLSGIAAKYDMSADDIKALNPGIESDDNIYYDDRLTVSVPSAAVQILVQKQITYKEDYFADIVYEDDGEMYIGESEVIQEGKQGTHTVTDLVTYQGELECGREQLLESVQVPAVAQIVRRGTKSRPTYMYPCTNWYVTSTFGHRWGRLHAGIDVGVPIGTTVRASRGGQVTVAGWVGGYGNCVMIDHGDGVLTVYGHLNECLVRVGQYVNQGETIALSGNTGRSTGPHLHFEIRVNGAAVDPAPYLEGRAN